jgi:hypothetical protein
MAEVSPQYLNIFDELAERVPELETAFRRYLSNESTLSDKASALAMAVADVASASGLDLLVPLFGALAPVYEITDEVLTFYLYEGFMESLVYQLEYAHIPLSKVRALISGEALLAWDAAVDYIGPASGRNAGA